MNIFNTNSILVLKMSNTQLGIVSKLMVLAESSKLNRKHAAAICHGRKILYSAVNTSRSKYNNYYTVCGHSEMNCIHAFANQRRHCV